MSWRDGMGMDARTAADWRAVLFDFDGTLADSEAVHLRSWLTVLPRYGVRAYAESFAARFVGVPAPAEARILVEEHGLAVTPAALVEEKESAFRAILEAEGIPLMPGAAEAVIRAAEAGLALGLVTGSPRFIVEPVLRQHGLDGRFRATVALEDVGRSKPDPECYLRCLSLLGCGPERAVAIEDSFNGVAAARNAGLVCVAVANCWTLSQDLSRANHAAGTLAEAMEWILAAGPS